MPHRIIGSCIVGGMKPYQLIAALMHEQKLGALPLAKKLGQPKLQPSIHRFMNGEVAEPKPTTAKPIAEFFGIPFEALYDEQAATEVAQQKGLIKHKGDNIPTPKAIGKVRESDEVEGVSGSENVSAPSQPIPTSMPDYSPTSFKSVVQLMGSLVAALDDTSRDLMRVLLNRLVDNPDKAAELGERASGLLKVQGPISKNKDLNKAMRGRDRDPVETNPAPLEH